MSMTTAANCDNTQNGHASSEHALHEGETLTTFARPPHDQQHAPPRQLALAAPRFFAPRRANGRSDWRAWQIDLFPLSHGCITCTTLNVRDSWESVSQGKSAQNRSFSRESRISVGRGQHSYVGLARALRASCGDRGSCLDQTGL